MSMDTRPSGRCLGAFARTVLAAAAGLCLGAGAQAMSFSEALDAARAYDPAYRAASYEYEAARTGVPIARASLLPSVALTAGEANVTGSRRFPNFQNQEVRIPLDYNAPQAALQMRMPLFNYEAISGFRQAQAQSEVAESVFRTQGIELIERLATAYMQSLLAEEGRRLVEGQIAGYKVQLQQAEQRLQRGEGTRVQLSQARAILDVANTRLLEALDQVELARIRLERLTGLTGGSAQGLPEVIVNEPLFPSRLTDWLEMAVRQSPTLQTRERNREVARQAMNRQQAGHLPRLDLVASLSRNENDASNTVGQSTVMRSIGVQLTVPLFNGGGVEASVRQAAARRSQVDEELRTERDSLDIEVQRHFQATVNGEKKVAAYVKALESTELAARGARRALEAGLGTAGDVSDTESARFNAARDLAQARVDVLLSRARLMMRAGLPPSEVAAEVDRFLGIAPRAAAATAAGSAAGPAAASTASVPAPAGSPAALTAPVKP